MPVKDDDVRKQLKHKKTKKEKKPRGRDMLSSGSTLLNLAISGRVVGAYIKGHYYLLVGDSNSGKSWEAHALMAEACINPAFDEYDIIYDNGEDGALFDVRKFFGKLADRIRPPAYTSSGKPRYSKTVEEFYYNVDDAADRKKPFIYVLDSMDNLDAEDDDKTFKQRKADHKAGRKGKGSYGAAKPKLNSMYVRKILGRLKETGSIAIIISQSRMNIGYGAMFNPKTRSGGEALTFYATAELWFSIIKKLKTKVGNLKLSQGILSKVYVKRTRSTGYDRTVKIPIYPSIGIDDIGSCVDFLVECGHWKKSQGGIKAKELELTLPREKLIRTIEREELELQLKAAVAEAWKNVEAACAVTRKNKYVET